MEHSVIYTSPYDSEVEYLGSWGWQWLDTDVIPSSGWKIEVKFKATQFGYFLYGSYSNSTNSIRAYVNDNTLSLSYGSNTANANISLGQIYTLVISSDGAFLDGTRVMDVISQTFTCPVSLYIFGYNHTSNHGTDRPFRGYIYYCRLWDSSNVLVRDFLPVRIGSTGYMYDKISKKLFDSKGKLNFVLGQDVASVVPSFRCKVMVGEQRYVVNNRIYKEYKYLSNTGTAYINTNYVIKQDDVISCKFVVNNLNNPKYYYTWTYGLVAEGVNDKSFSLYLNLNTSKTDFISISARFGNSQLNFSNVGLGMVMNIRHTFTSMNVNNISKNFTAEYFTESNKPLTIFNAGGTTNMPESTFSYFKIEGKMDLVPCQLVTDIPAILDGNGIARSAGECGMWDKIGNKFYGNVRSSGRFTVSND